MMRNSIRFGIIVLLIIIGSYVVLGLPRVDYNPFSWSYDLTLSVNQSGTNSTYYFDNITAKYIEINNTRTTDLTVDDFAWIKNNMLIGPDVGEYAYYNAPGDLYLGNGSQGIYDGQLGIWALPYGAALIVNEHMAGLNITSFGGTGTLNASTRIFCDTTDPFNMYNEEMFLEIISSTPSFTGATGEINDYINSSCVELSFGSAGGDTIVDATGMSYIVYPHPVLSVLDNGDVHFKIGENRDAQFEIYVENSTNTESVYIGDRAGRINHKSLNIEQDTYGFDGAIGIDVSLTGSKYASDVSHTLIALDKDASKLNDSTIDFIDMRISGEGNNNNFNGINLDPKMTNILTMGSEDVLDKVYYQSTNITGYVLSVGNAQTIFDSQNSYLYVGNDLNFTTASFTLTVGSSAPIDGLYYYCNSSGEWESLPGVISSTNAFQRSGGITFLNPENRGVCNKQVNGTPFDDPTNYSYIAIERTRNNIVTPPILDTVSIGGSTTYFVLQKNLIKFQGSNGYPVPCDSNYAGGIYYDSLSNSLSFCDGTSWSEFAAGGIDVTTHNELNGIQGGQATQYYHLTASEHSELTNWMNDVVLESDGNIKDLNISENLETGNLTVTDCTKLGNLYIFDSIITSNVTLATNNGCDI